MHPHGRHGFCLSMICSSDRCSFGFIVKTDSHCSFHINKHTKELSERSVPDSEIKSSSWVADVNRLEPFVAHPPPSRVQPPQANVCIHVPWYTCTLVVVGLITAFHLLLTPLFTVTLHVFIGLGPLLTSTKTRMAAPPFDKAQMTGAIKHDDTIWNGDGYICPTDPDIAGIGARTTDCEAAECN